METHSDKFHSISVTCRDLEVRTINLFNEPGHTYGFMLDINCGVYSQNRLAFGNGLLFVTWVLVKKVTFFTNGRSETSHDFLVEVGTCSMQGIDGLYQ